MATRAFYMQQAKSCFDMAAMSRDEIVRARWIERANEYLVLADAVGDDDPLAGASVKTEGKQQLQQQIKRDEDENRE